MPQGEIQSVVPLGTKVPLMLVSTTATRVVVGTVGYRRRTSLQTALRRGSVSRVPARSKDGSLAPSKEGIAARISARSCV